MNDYTSIADLYDLYVTDTRDHAFWTRRAEETEAAATETSAFILAVLEPADR